jgi:hypothetical protein
MRNTQKVKDVPASTFVGPVFKKVDDPEAVYRQVMKENPERSKTSVNVVDLSKYPEYRNYYSLLRQQCEIKA